MSRLLPGVPAVACFDTAFHARIPAAASTYALPAQWRQRWDLRRYGFHGLSHAYAARRAAEMTGARPGRSCGSSTCHLGAGASLAAVRGGVSVDTTMGFTPLEGLVMATRSGSVDPGLVLWLEEHVGHAARRAGRDPGARSGLLGLAGTADMRAILQREQAGDRDARARGRRLPPPAPRRHRRHGRGHGGLDVPGLHRRRRRALPAIRRRAAEGLGFLGIARRCGGGPAGEPGRRGLGGGRGRACLVVEAREDVEIARGVRQALAAQERGPG